MFTNVGENQLALLTWLSSASDLIKPEWDLVVGHYCKDLDPLVAERIKNFGGTTQVTRKGQFKFDALYEWILTRFQPYGSLAVNIFLETHTALWIPDGDLFLDSGVESINKLFT